MNDPSHIRLASPRSADVPFPPAQRALFDRAARSPVGTVLASRDGPEWHVAVHRAEGVAMVRVAHAHGGFTLRAPPSWLGELQGVHYPRMAELLQALRLSVGAHSGVVTRRGDAPVSAPALGRPTSPNITGHAAMMGLHEAPSRHLVTTLGKDLLEQAAAARWMMALLHEVDQDGLLDVSASRLPRQWVTERLEEMVGWVNKLEALRNAPAAPAAPSPSSRATPSNAVPPPWCARVAQRVHDDKL